MQFGHNDARGFKVTNLLMGQRMVTESGILIMVLWCNLSDETGFDECKPSVHPL